MFLDVETDRHRRIALVGVLTGRYIYHYPYPGRRSLARWLDEILPCRGWLYTFNGTAFDLPLVATYAGIDLTGRLTHVDLRRECADVGLTGGQKLIEAALGFVRDHPVLDWWDIRTLCDRHTRGCHDSLDALVGYNSDDLYGMRFIRDELGF